MSVPNGKTMVESVSGGNIREPLRLLEKSLRDGEPLPDGFVSCMARLVESGDIEVLAARGDGRTIGVLVLAFRPNVSLGGDFASVEDLFVEKDERRLGIGGKLLEAAAERLRDRGISYVEAHVEDDEAMKFYAALGYEMDGSSVMRRSYLL